MGRNTSVVVGGNIVVNLARLVSTIVLTRLLTAADYGAVGIVSSILVVLVMLSDVGFYAYVVRHERGDDPAFLDQVWTLRLVRGGALAALMVLLSGPTAGFFGQPALQTAIAASGLVLLLDAASSMAFATAPRAGFVRRLTAAEVIPALISIPAAILLALWLRSYWALLLSMYLQSLLKLVLSYALFPAAGRRLRFNRQRARELWRFGRYIAGSSIIHLAVTQADKVVLGRLLPLAQFGLYTLAWNLAQVPGNTTASYSSRVLYPLFARTCREAPEALPRVYYDAGRPMRFLYMIGAGAFIACAPFIVELLYDDRYLGAAFYLQLLAVAVMFRLPLQIAADALLAAGGVRRTFQISAVRLVWLLISAPALVGLLGPIGIVYAFVSMEIAAQLYCWYSLGKLGVLRIGKEAQFLLAAGLGYAAGAAVNAVGTNLVT